MLLLSIIAGAETNQTKVVWEIIRSTRPALWVSPALPAHNPATASAAGRLRRPPAL